jgi:hypothetical protein
VVEFVSHELQLPALPLEGLYVLIGQAEQAPTPVPRKPALHMQVVCARVPFVVVLASHAVQLPALPIEDLYVFTGQAEQAPIPVPRKPALQTQFD